MTVYASLFGVGKIIFAEWMQGIAFLATAAVAFWWIARNLEIDEAMRSGTPGVAPPQAIVTKP